jgi:hypothetical protein
MGVMTASAQLSQEMQVQAMSILKSHFKIDIALLSMLLTALKCRLKLDIIM